MGSRTSFVSSADSRQEDACAVMKVLCTNLGPSVAIVSGCVLVGSAKGGYAEEIEVDIDVSYRDEIEANITGDFTLVTLNENGEARVIKFTPGGVE